MTRPAVQPPGPWRFPEPTRTVLDNGLTVLAFDRPGQHVVSAALVIDLPLTDEPEQLEGVGQLLARALDEGTTSHPGLDFAEALERQGAAFGAHAGHDATQLFVDVPGNRLAAVLPLLAEAVTEPSLALDDVDRLRGLRLAEIEQQQAHPSHRASEAFRRQTVSGRAGRPVGGDRESVARLDAAALADFHQRGYRPEGATLILAGEFDADPIEAAAAAFGSWTGPATARNHPRSSPLPRRCLLLDRPGSVQADVRLGGFGIDRTDPRWAALGQGCYALGGAFLSRLNKTLREQRGYTYGVRLSPHPLRAGGFVSLQGSFRTEVAAAAIIEATELLDVSGKPFSETEIHDAINYTVGVTPLRYATATGITEQVAAIIAAGLTPDYLDAYLDAVRAVTPRTATQAVLDVVHPAELGLVVVGDAAAIAPALSAAGWPLTVEPFAG